MRDVSIAAFVDALFTKVVPHSHSPICVLSGFFVVVYCGYFSFSFLFAFSFDAAFNRSKQKTGVVNAFQFAFCTLDE